MKKLERENILLKKAAKNQKEEAPTVTSYNKDIAYTNQIVIETEKRISGIMKLNKLLTSQVEQKSSNNKKEQVKMIRLRIKTTSQKADIERLNLALKSRTK